MIGSAMATGALTLLALGIGPHPTAAQPVVLAGLQAGVIEGVVFDSTTARPLEGARVFLWNTQMFTTADVHGAFRIEDVPAGAYDLVFFHPRLTALGVSSGRTSITVGDGARVSVALATPSMPTIMSLLCLAEDPAAQRGRAVGYVGDAGTGVPFPGAIVILRWDEEGPEGTIQQSAQAVADSEGWYSHCSLPPDTRIQGQAYFLGNETGLRTFQLAAGRPSRVDFTIGSMHPGKLGGQILDAQSHRPIVDAEVSLIDTEFETVTDESGHFNFDDIPPGPYALSATHLAYGRRSEGVSIEAGVDLRVQMEMATEPIELAPLEVSVTSEGEVRALMVGGRLISRAEIDDVRAQSSDMGDLLARKHVPGLFLMRSGNDVCVGFRRGQITMSGARGDCMPAQVYINDVPASNANIALNLPAEVVDRIILVPPVEAGVMFKVGSSAGVIMVYTRSR